MHACILSNKLPTYKLLSLDGCLSSVCKASSSICDTSSGLGPVSEPVQTRTDLPVTLMK